MVKVCVQGVSARMDSILEGDLRFRFGLGIVPGQFANGLRFDVVFNSESEQRGGTTERRNKSNCRAESERKEKEEGVRTLLTQSGPFRAQ